MHVTPLCMADTMNPAEIDISAVAICTKVPYLEQGTNDDNTKQTPTLTIICEQYPPKAWANIYTDGSTTNAIHDSGAGVAICLPSGSTEAASVATRRHHTNYKVRGIAGGHLSCCGLTTEEHHGCISHRCTLSSTSPDQQQIATSSKSSATTQQQLQSGPSVDTRPVQSSWK